MKRTAVSLLLGCLMFVMFAASLTATSGDAKTDEIVFQREPAQLEREIDRIYREILDQQSERNRFIWRMDQIKYELYRLTGDKLREAEREIERLKSETASIQKKISTLENRAEALELGPFIDLAGTFANSDDTDWDSPAEGKIEAYLYGDKFNYLTAEIQVQWSQEQIIRMKGTGILDQYFPALQLTTDRLNRIKPHFVLTDLPGVKVARTAAGEKSGEGIKLSVLNASDLSGSATYDLVTVWSRVGEGPSIMTLESKQGYAQPNGTLNDLLKSEKTLMKLSTRTAEPVESNVWIPVPLEQYTGAEPVDDNVRYKSYAAINSIQKLYHYKKQSEERVAAATGTVRFAATFGGGLGLRQLDDLLEEYGLQVSQIYAIGVTSTGERYTVVWFDPELHVPAILRMIGNPRFTEFYITELEGKASAEELQKLNDHSDIAILDVSNDDEAPTGVYDLIRKLIR